MWRVRFETETWLPGESRGALAAGLRAALPPARRWPEARDSLVGLAPNVVDHLTSQWIEKHPVNREVAAGGVELG